jgi:hypothetical protein
MSTDPTGADITAIGKVLDTFGTRIMYECDEAIYRAGLAAGRARAIEEAARRFIPGPGLYMTQQQKEEAAAAIRALR